MSVVTWLFAFFVRKRYYQRSILDISRIYSIMDEVINDTNADRFLIYQVTNGGGRPSVGAKLYASVLYEYRNNHIRSLKDDFQQIEVDEGYINIMVRIEQRKAIFVKANEIDYSLLRSIFDRDTVTASYLFRIGETPTKYFYGSIQTTHKDAVLDIATIELAVSRIRSLFKNAK